MKNYSYIFFILISFFLGKAQVEPNSLMGLPIATDADITLTTPSTGSMVYNSDDNHVYVYTGTKFEKLYYGPSTYVGKFKIDSAGAINITGLPFEPTSITFTAFLNVEDYNLDSDNGTGNNDRGIENSFGTMTGMARNDSGTITQQVIEIGGHGNSINDISRYASNTNCIGSRFSDQNGNDLGKIEGALTNFNTDGFTINVTFTNGTITVNDANPIVDVQPADILNEGFVVIYQASR